jgi:phage FluMu protein gp41
MDGNFLISKQINFIKSVKAPLSIQKVYKKDTKIET